MTRLDQLSYEDIHVGMEVRVTQAAVGEHYRLNSNHRFRLDEAIRLRITAVHRTTGGIVARTIDTLYDRWSGRNEEMSFSFNLGQLEQADPNAPAPRKLGTKPEDTEEMTYIGIDHPGIQWLWDDMGTYADQQGYCPQYDALAIRLGIPGRPRDFTVRSTIGGIEVSATLKARSQREANEQFAKTLLESVEQAQITSADAD